VSTTCWQSASVLSVMTAARFVETDGTKRERESGTKPHCKRLRRQRRSMMRSELRSMRSLTSSAHFSRRWCRCRLLCKVRDGDVGRENHFDFDGDSSLSGL